MKLNPILATLAATNPLTWALSAGALVVLAFFVLLAALACALLGLIGVGIALYRNVRAELFPEKGRGATAIPISVSPEPTTTPSPAKPGEPSTVIAVVDTPVAPTPVIALAAQRIKPTAKAPRKTKKTVSTQELLAQCKKAGVKGANKRWSRNTLLAKLAQLKK